VVVENGYRIRDVLDGPSFDGLEATPCNMDLDGQLTQEQLYSSPTAMEVFRRVSVGLISNDFDANEFEQEEEEQEEEDRINDLVISDSEDSEDEEGGRHTMLSPVHAMPTPVNSMPNTGS
jgi:hypothetical protein